MDETPTPSPTPAASAKRRTHGRHGSAALIGVLTLLLGFAIAVQVHANSSADALTGLSEGDLIGILDDQNNRADRLRIQITQLQANLANLRSSGNRSAAARQQAQQEEFVAWVWAEPGRASPSSPEPQSRNIHFVRQRFAGNPKARFDLRIGKCGVDPLIEPVDDLSGCVLRYA